MSKITVGGAAPDFTLPAGDGTTLSLSDLRGKTVVLYFYPKDNTSGCTREACDFQEHLGRLKKKGVVVLGVSPDGVDSHRKFAEKYGVWKEKSLYGKKYMGVERTTFVIDGKGVITHIFPKVKVDGHVEELLGLL